VGHFSDRFDCQHLRRQAFNYPQHQYPPCDELGKIAMSLLELSANAI
jgi:hypothetical protein